MRTRKPEWRIRGIGTRWQFGFFHGLIRFGGRRSAYLLSDLVSLYYVLTRKDVRERSHPYLSRRFPERRGFRRLLDTFRLSRSYARTLVDSHALQRPEKGGLTTTFSGRQALLDLLAEGKGLVIVTAHVGAWQLGMTSLGHLGVPVGILTRVEPGDRTSPFPSTSEASQVIDPDGFLGGVPDMLEILLQGGVVCIMGDRAFGGPRSRLQVEFLGASIAIPLSPYTLASATGAPVAVLFPFKPGPNYYEMILADVFRIPPHLGREPQAYASFAQRFTDALLGFSEQHPYQFFNFFDLWAPPAP